MTHDDVDNHPYTLAVDTYDRECAQRSEHDAARVVFDATDCPWALVAAEYYSLVDSGSFSPREAACSLLADILGTPDLSEGCEDDSHDLITPHGDVDNITVCRVCHGAWRTAAGS